MGVPRHRIVLAGDQWQLWRTVCLRTAGFPMRILEDLGAPAAARAAEVVIEAEAEEAAVREQAFAALLSPKEELEKGSEELRARRADRKMLSRGRVPERSVDQGGPVDQTFAALRAAIARTEEARKAFARCFEDDALRATNALRNHAADPRFREALTWQNRRAVAVGVLDALPTGRASTTTSEQRNNELIVASYLQRYCAKNDTIGFFGPWGWASFVDDGPAVEVRPGDALLRARHLYFEQWPIDALAERIARDEGVKAWVPPRRSAMVTRHGSELRTREGRHAAKPAELLVFEACDGMRLVSEIAAQLLADHGDIFELESDVEDTVRALADAGVLVWRFDVPLQYEPDRALAERIARIGDDELRARAEAELARLLNAAREVEAAAGDAERVAEALERLEQTFTDLTGLPPTRNAGETYGGRGIVFEETVRDVDVAIGPAVLDAAGPALALVLSSARWFTHEVGKAYRHAYRATYNDLANGATEVPFVDFWLRAQRLTYGSKERPADGPIAELHRRWASVLRIDGAERRTQRTSEELAAAVAEAFAAPGPGWSWARQHSPDIMIAARGVEAILRGDFQIVLGEVHVALNSIDSAATVRHHPEPRQVQADVEIDVPEPRFATVLSRTWPKVSVRTLPVLVGDKDFWLEMNDEGAPSSRRVTAGELFVGAGADGSLRARTRDGRVDVDIVELLADEVLAVIMQEFRVVGRARHVPRVTVDRVVVARETWAFDPGELPFAFEKDPAARFLQVQRWARTQGLPRHVFVRSSVEVKPFYVDLASPALLAIFAKLVRKSAEAPGGPVPVTISEMLPGPDQLWLTDREGERYAAELRCFAVDLASPERQTEAR
jgi:hypothetical protein